MTDYEIYVFLLCLIVFLLLVALSVACICIITRLSLRLIHCGAEDQKILEEYKKNRTKKKQSRCAKCFDYAFSFLLCVLFILALLFSLAIRFAEETGNGSAATYRVVRTSSMSKKNAGNDYLWQNDLNDQIRMFDLIRTEQLPDEMELQLYDIVVYETNDILVVHRIVEIEEPNEIHPDCRHFRLQGDASADPDRFPVLYEQMRAIYRGESIPFIGSFIMFMQSPAGWLCTLLVVAAMFVAPILDKKLQKARNQRLQLYLNYRAQVSAGGSVEGAAEGGSRNG